MAPKAQDLLSEKDGLPLLGCFNELNLSYHNKETLLFTIYPSYGNFISVP